MPTAGAMPDLIVDRMTRTVIIFVACGALLLTVGLWAASFYGVAYQGAGWEVSFAAPRDGMLHVATPASESAPRWSRQAFELPRLQFLPSAGFFRRTAGGWEVHIPLWMPTVVLLVVLLVLGRAHGARPGESPELCAECGQSLLGLHEHCPECGSRVESVHHRIDRRLSS